MVMSMTRLENQENETDSQNLGRASLTNLLADNHSFSEIIRLGEVGLNPVQTSVQQRSWGKISAKPNRLNADDKGPPLESIELFYSKIYSKLSTVANFSTDEYGGKIPTMNVKTRFRIYDRVRRETPTFLVSSVIVFWEVISQRGWITAEKHKRLW